MKVISYLKSEIPGTNLYDLNLEEFAAQQTKVDESWLLYGYRILEKGGLSKTKRGGIYKYLNVTMPTEYCQNGFIHDSTRSFSEIYGICPYSCEWLNKLEDSNRYKYIYYPVSVPNNINIKKEKLYDVIYHGGIHSKKYLEMLSKINKFNYRYATMTTGINELTRYALKMYATNVNLTPIEKYNLLGQTKISICFNNFPLSLEQKKNIQNKPFWQNNEAFRYIDELIVPQFKSRINEAAILGVINLVERDQWNVIENFYESGKDFIYFESVENIPEIITKITRNYEDYTEMRENAYKKSKRYSRKWLYTDILNSHSWHRGKLKLL